MIGQLRNTSPRRIGPYVTLARLGAGGMGEVFLARPDGATGFGPGDLVAVKAIRNELATDTVFRRRFRREAEVAASVDSPFVARLVASEALTMTGMLVGTPGFMAPEQIEGSHAVVPASDVFSLGAVLCHAATGRGPFDDPELASVVFRIAQGDADLSRVPDELRGLIAECLAPAPDPALRPAPAALAERLETPGTARFPWPSEVLSLFAEYRSAAAEFEPGAPYVPTMPGEPPTAPAAPGPAPAAGRRPWQWIVAAGVATAAVTAAALVLPDAPADPADPADPAENTPAATPVTRPTAGGSASSSLVRTYGTGHSGELGASAVTPSALPGGWQPWSRKKPEGAKGGGSGCVLARSTLVCRDGRGAARRGDGTLRGDRRGPLDSTRLPRKAGRRPGEPSRDRR